MYQYFKGPNSTESHTPLTEAQRESVAKDEMFALNAKIRASIATFPPMCLSSNPCYTQSRRQVCRVHMALWWDKWGPEWEQNVKFLDEVDVSSNTIPNASSAI